MSERNLKILTPSGTMETFVVRPSDDLTPLVIIYMDIWGVREELREIARQVAALGYSCALPDLFYRQGHIRHEFRDENGRMLTLAKLSEAQKEQVRAPLRNLSDAMVMMDTEALLQYLIAKGEIASGPIAAVGYCMGGRHALVAAGTFPQRFHFAASLHGTSLVTESTESAHKIAKRSAGEIYCGFGELDHYSTPDVRQTLEQELRGAGVAYTCKVHQGADHGYALPDRDLYDAAATRLDWEIITEKLHRLLPLQDSRFQILK